MTRGFDALGFDPAPGGLGQVEASAERYRRASERLGLARDAMAALVQPAPWDGDASEACARRVADLREYLDSAARSMSQAAAALTDWHGELSEFQRRAWELELQARDADVEVVAAAERLKRQHDEAAHRVAELLDTARDLDDPALLSRCLDAAGDAFAEGMAARNDVERIVSDVMASNARVIDHASDVLARLPYAGHTQWTPRDLGAVALENAIAAGLTDAPQPERTGERR